MKTLLTMALLAMPAFATFPNGYVNCKVVTTQKTMVSGASDLINYPLTVILTDTDLRTVANGGLVNNSSGYDIAFYPDCSGAGTALKWEMESYNAVTGAIVAHVLRPCLSATVNDTIGMYFGGPFSTFQSTASAVWSNSFVLVSHMANVSSLSDSSGSVSAGTNHSSTNTTGRVDGGSAFASASSQYQDFGTTTSLAPAAMTLSVWIKATSLPNSYNSVIGREKSTPSPGPYGYTLLVKSNGKLALYIRDSAAADIHYDGTGSNTLSAGTWYYVALTYTAGGSMIGYVNGAADGSASGTANGLKTTSADTFYVGSSTFSSRYWNGAIDEVRVASVARSADWILTEYRNQSAPATYLSVGPRLTGTSQRFRHSVRNGS